MRQTKIRRRTRYVQITEIGARALDQALDCSVSLVWFEILFRVWNTGKMTVELGNKTLTEMGVSRWAKYRAFETLRKSWTNSVKRQPRQSLQVTLLKRGCVACRKSNNGGVT